MTNQSGDLPFDDASDIDWDAELQKLPQQQILIEYAHKRVMRMVDNWYNLRAGDAIGFDDMPAELQLDPDQRIGMIVVDQYAEAICAALGFDFDELDPDRGQELIGAILGCITQGVSIGLGAIPDNDDSNQNEESR